MRWFYSNVTYNFNNINQYIDKYIGHHYKKLQEIITNFNDIINVSDNLEYIVKASKELQK